MGRSIAALSALCACLFVAGAAVAAPTSSSGAHAMRPGDKYAYDLSMEIQVHLQPSPHSTLTPVSADTTVEGSETLTVLRADRDGTLHARLNVDLQMRGNGQTQPLARSVQLKISPNHTTSIEGGGDSALAQYFSAFGQAQKQFAGRTLHIGDVYNLTLSMPGAVPMTINTTAKVVAEKTYRGYPTFAIASTGTGALDTTLMGESVKGKMTFAGTTYFDQQDQLYVGGASRANADAQIAGAQGGHLTTVATTSIVLRSLTHGAAPSAAPSTAAPASQAPSPAVSPGSPTPTTSPSGYYTPPPPSPTPSYNPNPYPPTRASGSVGTDR